jgi:AraC family transcriptional regulator
MQYVASTYETENAHPRGAERPILPALDAIGLTLAACVARSHSDAPAQTPPFGDPARGVRVSSRGLGWGALNYERRSYPPSSLALERGSSQHLIFLSLTTGRLLRDSEGRRVEHEVHPGCVAVVPAGTPVSWVWATPISFSVLRLDPACLDRVALSVFGLRPRDYRLAPAERRHDTAITNITGVLAREVTRAQLGGRLYATSLASMLAVHLLRHYAQCTDGRALNSCSKLEQSEPAEYLAADSGSVGQPRAVSDAVAFMHANYGRELSLIEIARAAHVSPFHLARLFKRSLGVSPHQYLIQLRVNSARWLLSAGSGERSLAEVASAVGFADQSHLTRHFKRATGVTPRQFARA